MVAIAPDALAELCVAALSRAGAMSRDARVLADATVQAEQAGKSAVGVRHLFDYLDGYRGGRIANSTPLVSRPATSVVDVDARDGLAQTAFAAAYDDFLSVTGDSGIAALWIRNSYTSGELGYYVRRLAGRGVIGVAMANSPALMSVGGATASILGTNPLAYAVPRSGRSPLVVDQASSATAFVNIRRAAEQGEAIPEGWALGPDGEPTRDAGAALQGTLLPFGGYRGGNIALLVEILATLSGASFSLDAAPFDDGDASPRVGVFVLGIDPAIFGDAVTRLTDRLESLRNDHGVRLPGRREQTAPDDPLEIDADVLRRLAGEAL